MRKVGYFGPGSPDGQGDRNNYYVPIQRTAQVLTQSRNSDRALFHPENARLLSKSAVFALRTYASLVVGGLQGGHGKPNFLMGAVPVPCSNASQVFPSHPTVSQPQTLPSPTLSILSRRCSLFCKLQSSDGVHR